MKGRNSTVVSIRLSDSVYAMVKTKANGQSVPEYIKEMVIHSVNTINEPIHSVNTRQEKLTALRDLIQSKSSPVKEETGHNLPVYNPAIHKPGDKVRVPRYKGKGFNVIMVPELDGDGHEIPWRDYV